MTAPLSSKKTATFLLLCLILIAVGFRIVELSADPPSDFDWSGGYFADEGYWSHNARNEALYGNALQDEWDGRVMSPLFTAFQSVVFRTFGPGLVQVRIIGILCAVLLVGGSFVLVRKHHGDHAAFLTAVLVGLNYPLLVLARQGILDPFATALAWIALVCSAFPGMTAAFAAGLLLAAACTTKFFMVYAFLPVLASILLFSQQRPGLRCTAFLAGASTAAAFWLTLVYLPHKDMLLAYNNFYASQQAQSWAPLDLLKNVITQPFFLYAVKSPALLALANLMLWVFLLRPRSSSPIERVCWAWLLTGILFFALWRYRPLRYYTSMFPPLAVLAGFGLLRLNDLASLLRDRRTRIAVLIGAMLPFAQIAFVLIDRFTGAGIVPLELGIRTGDAIGFLLLSVLLMWALFLAHGRSRWIRIAFFAVFLFCDIGNYLEWMLRPQYAAATISADLQKRLGSAVLTGQWAPELVLENRLRAVPVWKGFVNSENPFSKYGITHMLLWRYPLGDEAEKFAEWYPEEFKRFRPVARYTIKNSDLELYQREDVP